MTTGDTPALVRDQDGSTRATLLELLFDVVFVAALAMVSGLITKHDAWPGVASVLLMLTAIWWTWAVTSTTTEFYDPQQAFATMLLLWQIYVFRAGQLLEAGLKGRRATRVAPYTHLVLLVGVVGTASAFHLVVEHPDGTTSARLLILIIGGPMLFVLGRALFALVVADHPPWWRAAWQLLPLLALPWAGGWPPVLVSAVVALALAGHVLLPPGGRETTPGLRPQGAG
ncbi:low temperature requirement protein A [Micromonospora profundi]|uniref:low temperature requirement protein A n=1 Tax=Micromonospora TaxID=1873 RepID=UPI0033BBE638